jgi:predicted transcriptional regulator
MFFYKDKIAIKTTLRRAANKRRDRLQILAEIAYLCKTPKSTTYLMKNTNLSYKVLRSCIIQMLLNELIENRSFNGRKQLITTKKGLDFCEKFIELQQSVEKTETITKEKIPISIPLN